MSELKIEWREGAHGVQSVVFLSDEAKLTFTPGASLGAGTTEKPFDRGAALQAVKSLCREILSRLSEGHNASLT